MIYATTLALGALMSLAAAGTDAPTLKCHTFEEGGETYITCDSGAAGTPGGEAQPRCRTFEKEGETYTTCEGSGGEITCKTVKRGDQTFTTCE